MSSCALQSSDALQASYTFQSSCDSIKPQVLVKLYVCVELDFSQAVRFSQGTFQEPILGGWLEASEPPSRTFISSRFRSPRRPEEPSGHLGLRNLPEVDVLDGVRELPANHPKWIDRGILVTSFV